MLHAESALPASDGAPAAPQLVGASGIYGRGPPLTSLGVTKAGVAITGSAEGTLQARARSWVAAVPL